MAKKSTDYPAKHRQILQDIKEQKFHKSYLIYGEEGYLRLRHRDMLIKALMGDADQMNMQRYEGAETNPAAVIDMAETLPFFAERRVLLIENSGFFKKGCPELATYLKEQAETTNIVFVETEVDKRKDIYKSVDKEGLVLECTEQSPEDLQKWAVSILSKNGKKITQSTMNALIDRVGTDMSNIANELEKLICYVGEREIVEAGDVDAVCANWITNRIFDMTDAICEKNTKRAMDLYYDLLALKVRPEAIYGAITRQFNVMLQVKEMDNHRETAEHIASAIGVNPYFVRSKYLRWVRNYSMNDLRGVLELCMSGDEAMKNGLLDRNINVEILIAATTGGAV